MKISDTTLSYSAIVSASLYFPLTFWATNAWDLASPATVLIFGVGVSLLGSGAFLVIKRRLVQPLLPALSISITVMVLMSWNRLPIDHPLLLLALIGIAIICVTLVGDAVRRGIAVALILLFGIAPAIQVVAAHVTRRVEVPLTALTPRTPARATGAVEDVLVVVTDSYPSVAWAQKRFGHDTSFLQGVLDGSGFTTPSVGWSQHPNTSFSLSTLLELRPVVDTTSDQAWSNSSNLRSIIGGESLVASTLRSAGFSHTQIESGWHLSKCSQTDACVRSSWLNETTWGLLHQSVAGGWLEAEYGSWIVAASMSVDRRIQDVRHLFGNGTHDYVFAHVMIPHEPYVVDAECQPSPPKQPQTKHEAAAIRRQLSCADQLLSRIVGVTDEDTAVLITGDHGIKSTGQLKKDPTSWTEEDIADAFTVLLSYRLPVECPGPVKNTNTVVMAAIVECATTFDAPPNDGASLIGLRNHRWIDSSTQSDIERDISGGSTN